MANYYEENNDIQFIINHFTDWNSLIPLHEADFADAKKYKETKEPNLEFAPSNTKEALDSYTEIYTAYGEMVAEELAPHVLKMDSKGLKFDNGKVHVPEEMKNFIDLLRESGLLAVGINRLYGGLFMGHSARLPITEMISRADASTAIVQGYFNMGEIIELFGTDEMRNEYLPLFAQGKMLGAMALTESNFGSDLQRIKTKAVLKQGREFELTGTKIFITQGCGFGDDVKAAIFTIARSKENMEGAKGVSFFLVENKDVQISRIEEKMGLHVSSTCEVLYEKSKGILIGEEGKGLVRYAIAMMNGARLGIATQSLGIAQAAAYQAHKYASERIQFGVTINQLPAVKRMLNEIEARVQASRALIYRTATFVDTYEGLLKKFEKAGKDEREIRKYPEVVKNDKLAKLLTPVSKLTASEFCNKVAYDAVQVHGGVGYTREFEIEKIYRDARITSIYEGTSQLQTIAAIGGIVEGVTEKSILSEHMNEEMAKLKDAQIKKTISTHWASLKEMVSVYKDKEKEVREMTSWDIVWHFCYTYCELVLALHLQTAKDKNLSDVEESKSKVLKDFMQIADREIAACMTQVKNA